MTIHVAHLDREHINIAFGHELLTTLKSKGLSPTVERYFSVVNQKHGEDNSGYIVAEVTHLTKPKAKADIVADSTTTYICPCTGFYHHCYDQNLGAKVDDCQHIERVKQKTRGNIDDKQQTL